MLVTLIAIVSFLLFCKLVGLFSKQQPKKDQEHREPYPHEHCPYTSKEIFFDEIRRVLDFYPWIDNAMIQWPNRPANRDAFISSLCRAYQEKVMDILAKQNKKQEDLFKMMSMLKGMHLKCGQCEPCKKREATVGKETDLTIPPCEFAGKFEDVLHETLNNYNFYSLHRKN